MKGFRREDQAFSLCGLNCGLCPMRIGGYCPGCGGGEGNQSCQVARCSLAHGGIAYCWQCAEYPCARYQAEDEYDTLITTQHRKADTARMMAMGPASYCEEQARKAALLRDLLARHNDGRRKGLYCLAVNLLEEDDVRAVLQRLDGMMDAPVKERAALAAEMLQVMAKQRQVTLRLRKKKK